jgi:hypothetical protein
MNQEGKELQRNGFVSIWVGEFLSIEAAEAYFGIPDEIGVYLPPEGFAADLGLDELPVETLEVHFEHLKLRLLPEVLKDATFSASFIEEAIEAANRQGINEAQGIALLYDFDYQAKANWKSASGPMRFVGTFPFARLSCVGQRPSVRDPRIEIRTPEDNLL